MDAEVAEHNKGSSVVKILKKNPKWIDHLLGSSESGVGSTLSLNNFLLDINFVNTCHICPKLFQPKFMYFLRPFNYTLGSLKEPEEGKNKTMHYCCYKHINSNQIHTTYIYIYRYY